MKRRRLSLRVLGTLAAVGSLVACANLPAFTPDPNARAPHLEGYGRSDIAITTRSPRARQLFNEGVLQAYAFNENEAVRTFKAALAQDADCAMCAWGVAWQLGPNINDSDRRLPDAVNYVDYALGHLRGATPRERALVEALAIRYAHKSMERETAPLAGMVCGAGGSASDDEDKVNPLDTAYAARMRAMADAWPADPDVLSLYAEAEMIATPGNDAWKKDGTPVGRIGEVADRLERLLASNTGHIGLNHYMVHIADALPIASRGVAAADRLGTLAPQSPHLVHMPAHTYVHVGRYADAVRVNEAAVAADVSLAQAQKAQGFTVTKDWRGHNQHFLWYAAVMEGREDLALETAKAMDERVAGMKNAFAEYVRSLPAITLVRFGQWGQILALPQPEGDRGISQIWFEYARGIALARLGRIDEAEALFARLQATAAGVRAKYTQDNRPQRNLRATADIAEFGLQAELALARRQFDGAIAAQLKAMKAAERVDSQEPPALADGTRLKLGEIQVQAQRWEDAEATYRQALAEHPGSGWALRGLAGATRHEKAKG